MDILQMSAMGTVLIGFTVLLRKVLGNRLPQGCYLLLWLLVGLRLLLPVTIASPYSVYNIFATHDAEPIPAVVPIAPSHISDGNKLAEAVTEQAAQGADLSWMTMLWLTGMLVCLCYLIGSHWRYLRRYALSIPVKDSFIQQWQAQHPLWRSYQIRSSQLVQAPLTYGLWHPVILLPAEFQTEPTQLKLILLHEWNHIRHLDILWQWLLMLVCSLHWFNPAVWIMYVLCRRDLELFCDAATVKQLSGSQRRGYALLLLQEAGNVGKRPSLFDVSSITGYDNMKERIQFIMTKKQHHWKNTTVIMLLMFAVFLLFGTSAAASTGNGQMADGLKASITHQNGAVQFQIPNEYTADNGWSIAVYGAVKEDGADVERTFFDAETQQNSWQAGKVYTIAIDQTQFTKLQLMVSYPAEAQRSGKIIETWDLLRQADWQMAGNSTEQQWQWPVMAAYTRTTSGYGTRVHPVSGEKIFSDSVCISGDDIAGKAVVAVIDGTVKECGYQSNWGNYIVLTHADGLETHYRHCKDVSVKQGQQVTGGTVLATVGQTGRATGPCLGFAVYQQGKSCDPTSFITRITHVTATVESITYQQPEA